MKQTYFLISSLLILMLLGLSSCTEKGRTEVNKKQPNFIFLLVDDLGWTDLGCYGSTFYETPNIDQLAVEGMKFTDAYAACPVCSPTRASIMTGKYPARINLTDWIPGRQFYSGPQVCDKLIPRPFAQQMELEEVTIAETLKRAGYQTFFAGKWHLGEDSLYWPENQGFDANIGGWGKGWPKGGYFSPYENPRLPDGPEGEHLTDRITTESIRFLEEVRDRPFFLYLSFYAVHTPLQAKEPLVEKYKRKADSLGLTERQQLITDKEWMTKAPPTGSFAERVIQAHPVYGGMVETLDRNIGRIMEKLEELGLEENTIVIFTSDNGGLSTAEGSPTSNLPLRAGKGWLYEGGIREPAIIKWPGMTPPGSVSEAPVTSTDYYPTILEMAGLSLMPDQHIDGKSLVPLFQNGTKWPERPLFWHYPHYSNQGGKPGAAVRLGPYKLIEFFEEGNYELYDLATDPGESKDLYDALPEKAAELEKFLKEWQKEVDAGMMDPNPGFDEDYQRVIN